MDITFHICFSCFFQFFWSWYFLIVLCFFFLMLLSAGIATLITTADNIHHYFWFVDQQLLVLMSHRILTLLFSHTFSDDLEAFSPHLTQMFLYTIPATSIYLSVLYMLSQLASCTQILCAGRSQGCHCTVCTLSSLLWYTPAFHRGASMMLSVHLYILCLFRHFFSSVCPGEAIFLRY